MKDITVEQMLEAGLHFGHQTFRWNPKMRPFIFDARDGVHIIDLTKTEQKLKEALDFVGQIAARGEILLLVGTKRQASKIIKEVAQKVDLPYVSTHWPGGLLTNFKTVKDRITYLKSLREKMKAEDFGDMTKKEIGQQQKELARLEESFGGLDSLDKLPGAIFLVDIVRERIALREALKLGVPVIAMVDTNTDPTGIEFPIPANDDAKNGIFLIVNALAEVFSENREAARVAAVAKADAGEEKEEVIKPTEAMLEQKEVQLTEARGEDEKAEAEKREKGATTKRKR